MPTNSPPRLIGLAGHARSGKDTVAEILSETYGYEVRAIADPLKRILYRTQPTIAKLVDMHGWEDVKQRPGVRSGLQILGATLRREFGPALLPETAIARGAEAERLVISDVRIPFEVDTIRKHGGIVIWISRPGVGPANNDVTEQPVEYDVLIENDGTIEELHDAVFSIIEGTE